MFYAIDQLNRVVDFSRRKGILERKNLYSVEIVKSEKLYSIYDFFKG